MASITCHKTDEARTVVDLEWVRLTQKIMSGGSGDLMASFQIVQYAPLLVSTNEVPSHSRVACVMRSALTDPTMIFSCKRCSFAALETVGTNQSPIESRLWVDG